MSSSTASTARVLHLIRQHHDCCRTAVLSAISGLQEATTAITKPAIVGITIAVLVILFGVQHLGTGRISMVFAPVITVWLLFNAALGFYNLSACGWGVWKVGCGGQICDQSEYMYAVCSSKDHQICDLTCSSTGQESACLITMIRSFVTLYYQVCTLWLPRSAWL